MIEINRTTNPEEKIALNISAEKGESRTDNWRRTPSKQLRLGLNERMAMLANTQEYSSSYKQELSTYMLWLLAGKDASNTPIALCVYMKPALTNKNTNLH